jgi:hypothetical protein
VTTWTTSQPSLTASTSGGSPSVCSGTSPGTFTANPSGGTGSYTYQWYTTSGIVNGATNRTYNPGTITSTTGYYCAVTSGSCGTVDTPTVTITVPVCATAGVCQTGGACSGGSCVTVTNVANNVQATGCNGTCQACQSGACGYATSGSDPGNQCTAAYNACLADSTPTGPDGNCNGAGACNTSGIGPYHCHDLCKNCASGACTGTAPNGTTCGTCRICASGACTGTAPIGTSCAGGGTCNGQPGSPGCV